MDSLLETTLTTKSGRVVNPHRSNIDLIKTKGTQYTSRDKINLTKKILSVFLEEEVSVAVEGKYNSLKKAFDDKFHEIYGSYPHNEFYKLIKAKVRKAIKDGKSSHSYIQNNVDIKTLFNRVLEKKKKELLSNVSFSSTGQDTSTCSSNISILDVASEKDVPLEEKILLTKKMLETYLEEDVVVATDRFATWSEQIHFKNKFKEKNNAFNEKNFIIVNQVLRHNIQSSSTPQYIQDNIELFDLFKKVVDKGVTEEYGIQDIPAEALLIKRELLENDQGNYKSADVSLIEGHEFDIWNKAWESLEKSINAFDKQNNYILKLKSELDRRYKQLEVEMTHLGSLKDQMKKNEEALEAAMEKETEVKQTRMKEARMRMIERVREFYKS